MPDGQNIFLGVITTVIAILGYGSVFVPIKKFEARDGLFVAMCMSIGQVAPCLITSVAYGAATIFPLAMIAGVLYALGNSFSVIIMENIGMAVGSLLWNITTCLWGWAVARFGLFGTTAIPPANDFLNIIGVITICVGGSVFALVRSSPIDTRPAPYYTTPDEIITVKIGRPSIHREKPKNKNAKSLKQRMIGVGLALLIGSFYGNMPTPANIMLEKAKLNYTNEWERPPVHQGAYMFSYAIGSLFTSIVIFFTYSMYRKNMPFMNVEIACPAIVSGLIYGTATSACFVALENIDQVIALPVITISPGIIVSLWSILLFNEIRGRRNLATLVVAYGVTIAGVILIAVSKIR